MALIGRLTLPEAVAVLAFALMLASMSRPDEGANVGATAGSLAAFPVATSL